MAESFPIIPKVVGLRIYPIKSLDPCSVTVAEIGTGGSLTGDRQFALVDASGRVINGKREPRLHAIRAQFDLAASSVSFNNGRPLHLNEDRSAIGAFFSDILGGEVTLAEDASGGLLDDPMGSHLTVVSTATLELVSGWFGWNDVEEARRRFRSNIEIDGVPPFWEDRLFLPEKAPVHCHIGMVDMAGRKPCPRCPVPARDSYTGVNDRGFQKKFEEMRKGTLPEWSTLGQYPHGYYLSTTMVVSPGQAGKHIRCGDGVFLK